jgi:cytochrome c-type biogenesis protein CcmH/NrfG
MIRFTTLMISLTLMVRFTQAQTLEEGKKLLYYERFQSASEKLSKVVEADPANIEAVYWLGQAHIDRKDSLKAKDLYAKALQTNGNALILLAGMGQIELMEGKKDQARQRFETALDLNKKKNDIAVYNAVALANIKPRSGDLAYALEKLNAATLVKNFRNAETYLLMGDAYRKLIDGGNAVSSYNKALAIDPKYAAAKHRIGKVYLTQNNKEFFLPAFEDAVQMDPGYTPSYFELFYYWYFRDVNRAAQYLDKYIENADQGPDMEYLKTDFLYASGKFGESKDKAKSLIAQYGKDVTPRMYRLVAYTSDTTGDLQGAIDAMNKFLTLAGQEEILSSDYEEMSHIYSKMAGQEQEAFRYLEMAVNKDTLIENKVKYIAKAAALAKKTGNRKAEAYWLGIAYKAKKNPNQNDLYNWGLSSYQSGNYALSDSIFCNLYQTNYPNEIYGYLWCARSKQAMDDSVNSKGLAVESYKMLAEKARQFDPVKYKTQAVSSYFFLVQYYNDIAKDRPTAIGYCEKILEVDTANADARRIKDILNKAAGKQGAAPPKKPSAPPGGSGASLAIRNKGFYLS